MRVPAVTTSFIAGIVFQAVGAAAQSHVEALPSLTIGSIYDDNLFAQTQGDAGHLLTLRPGLGTAIDTPRLSLSSLFTFDAQRSNHRDLTMIDARRHGDARVQYRTTDATTIGLMAQYDRTETPGEINIGTGILTDRRQAQRWEVSPNFAHKFGPHTSITGSYDWMAESLVDNGTGRMQVVRMGLSQIYTARSAVTGWVMARHFADPTDATNGSDSVAVLAGWDHQFSSASRFSIQAGPRGSPFPGPPPGVAASLMRGTSRLQSGLDDPPSETTVPA